MKRYHFKFSAKYAGIKSTFLMYCIANNEQAARNLLNQYLSDSGVYTDINFLTVFESNHFPLWKPKITIYRNKAGNISTFQRKSEFNALLAANEF